jgi:hypothetical protein
MYAPMSMFNRRKKGEGEKEGQEKQDTEGHVRRPCDGDPAEPRIDIRSPKKRVKPRTVTAAFTVGGTPPFGPS